jgi:hypothetical protein
VVLIVISAVGVKDLGSAFKKAKKLPPIGRHFLNYLIIDSTLEPIDNHE